MDITSIEISAALLERLARLREDEAESLVHGIRFEVTESGDSHPAGTTADDSVIGVLTVNTQDGATAILTLKRDSDEVAQGLSTKADVNL